MINIDEILDNDVLWQMSLAERASILYLINKLPSRKVAIEVGSFKGGFTRVLAQHFDKVYSCDINHTNIVNKEQYTNVEWLQGDSRVTLPSLIQEINETGEEVSFILIDGDHEYDGVVQDIKSVLQYRPIGETIILIHDSWHAPSREAINQADWNSSPYVEYVEKDFAPGDLIGSANGNMLIGGLALITMSPKKRRGKIEIEQSQDYMYRSYKQILDRSKDYLELHAVLKRLML